ncbi:hypothetical protein QM012_004240 [Aureobasidium pullulans]|uniref:Uncharacterized protein n=1 Tax=Aureobasidium pullulans TaxID=5580 RepID=A0ABR0TSJ9_AURPU
MRDSLNDAIDTALATASTEAVDAIVKQTFTTAIEEAVRKHAQNLKWTLAAAVDSAMQEQAKKLEQAFAAAVTNAVEERMKKLEVANKKMIDAKVAKAVRKTELKAKIREVCSKSCTLRLWEKDANAQEYQIQTMNYVESVAGYTFPDLWTFWNKGDDPRGNLAFYERELDDLENEEEHQV